MAEETKTTSHSLSATANMSLTAEEVEENVERTFGGVEYILGIRLLGSDAITIDMERKTDGDRWRGDFSCKYIEEITAKTGNFKKFNVFVRMLLSAVRSESESVLLDVLTFADLETLRARRSGAAQTSAAAAASQSLQANNKRYLILTYVAEFDRVHYPLPLAFDDHPDPEHLKGIIRRLREQLEVSRTALGPRAARVTEVVAEVRRLREENAGLKAALRRLEQDRSLEAQADLERATSDAFESGKELRVTRKERDLLKERAAALEEALDSERSKAARAIRRLERELEEAREEAARAKEQLKELRLKNRDLTTELEVVMRRASSKGVGGAALGGGSARAGGGGASAGRGASASARRESPSSRRQPSASAYGASAYGGGGGGAARGGAALGVVQSTASIPTRGRATSSARGRTGSADRARSTTPTGRFDPTAWAKAQQDKKRGLESNKRRTFTPPSSRPQSGASTPTRDRSPAARRGGAGASTDAPGGGGGGVGRSHPSYLRPTVSARSREASPSSFRRGAAAGPPAPKPAWGGGASPGRGSIGRDGSFGAGPGRSSVGAAQRTDSPGRALQDVRDRLTAFKAGEAVHPGSGPAPRPPEIPRSGSISKEAAERRMTSGNSAAEEPPADLESASASLADVDARLQRLQNFLREAKTSHAETTA